MENERKGNKLIRNTLIYSISGLLHKCFSFFLLPLYTVYLTTEDYGITTVATSFISTMSLVVILALHFAVKRFYVDYKDDREKLKRFYGTICMVVFLTSSGAACLCWVFRGVLSKYVFSGIDFYPVILNSLHTLVVGCQHTIFEQLLASQQQALKASILSLISFLITVAFNILFVVILGMGATGSLLSTLISNILYTVYFLAEMIFKKQIRFCIDWKLLKRSLKYSIPIMPHNLSNHIVTLVSKLLIGNITSLASLGIYSVASQFGSIADTVQSYVNNAYGPWLFETLHARHTDYKETIRENVGFLSAVVGLFMVGIALFAQDYILLLVDPSYHDAWRYVALIVMVYAFKNVYNFHAEALLYDMRASQLLFIATVCSGFLNVFLSVVMVPYMGVYGSILADMLAMLVRVAITVGISRKFQDLGLRIGDFVMNILLVLATITIGLAPAYIKYGNTFSFTNFLYKCAVVICYVVFIAVSYRKNVAAFLMRVKKKFGKK